MPQTCRQYWWNLQGRCTLNFNWDAINHDSVVLISASEYRPNPPDPAHSPRFVGAANIGVETLMSIYVSMGVTSPQIVETEPSRVGIGVRRSPADQ